MRIHTGCTMMLGAMLCSGTLVAQSGSTGTTAGAASQSAASTTADSLNTGTAPKLSDKAFVKKAIMGNHSEIDAAQLALQKSSNDQVKQYAQKMVDDHTKMLDELHTLAQSQNIKYEDKPTPEGAKLKAKLEGLSGTAFDKAYINGMIKDHKEDVQDFTNESSNGKVQPVKDAASKSLPIIQDHLQMVQGLKSGM